MKANIGSSKGFDKKKSFVKRKMTKIRLTPVEVYRKKVEKRRKANKAGRKTRRMNRRK